MLDKNTVSVLKWFKEHSDESYSIGDLYKAGLVVDFPTLDWLAENDCLHRWLLDEFFDPNYEDPPYTYRISPGGLAKLEERRSWIFSEIRAWTTAAIAIAAFVKSFFF